MQRKVLIVYFTHCKPCTTQTPREGKIRNKEILKKRDCYTHKPDWDQFVNCENKFFWHTVRKEICQ